MTTALHDLITTATGLPCRTTDPELWFSDYPTDRRRATALCAACPLLAACRTYGVETRQVWGVWGGLDLTAVETYCGTDRGYLIHARNKERACGPCDVAHEVLLNGRRRRQLEVEHRRGGTVRGYDIHLRLLEAACEACLEARRVQSRRQREHRQRLAVGLRSVPAPPGTPEELRGAPAGVQSLAIAS